jgi:hypothetical protein
MKRTPTADLDPRASEWIQRASDEALRRQGRYRALVLHQLAPAEETTDEGNGWQTRVVRTRERIEPSREDLIAAYDESLEPLPSPIVDHVFTHYVKGLPRKRGPNAPRAYSTWDEVLIVAYYQHQLTKAKLRAAAGLTSAPADRAKKRTARHFGISVSTLEKMLTTRKI